MYALKTYILETDLTEYIAQWYNYWKRALGFGQSHITDFIFSLLLSSWKQLEAEHVFIYNLAQNAGGRVEEAVWVARADSNKLIRRLLHWHSQDVICI